MGRENMRVSYFILALVVWAGAFPSKMIGQEIRGPEDILNSLASALVNVDRNSNESFRIYSDAARQLTERGNYQVADSLYQIAMPLASAEPDSTIILNAIASRAYMYKIQGRFTMSLEGYLQFLDYYSNRSDSDQLVLAYAQLAEFYRAIENQNLCYEYVTQALNLLKENNTAPEIKAYAYNRAAAFQNQFLANRDSTIYYSNLAVSAAVEANDKFILALSQNELGFVYMNIDKSDTARNFEFYRSAMDNFLSEQRYRDYISVMENLARNYYLIDMPQKTIEILKTATSIAEANNWKTYLDGSYVLLAEAYNAVGNYELSHNYMIQAYFNKIDNLRAEHAIEASELTATYEKDIAEQKLQEQQIQTQLAQEEARSNQKALIATVIISIVLLAIAIISVQLYFRFRRKNTQLSTQQKVIRETNEQLTNALAQKNVLYRELNHRVKNNLTVLSGLVYLQESNQPDFGQRQVYETLRQRIQSMAMVHQNLYEFNDALNINFQEYLEQLVPNLAAAYQGNPIKYEIKCDDFNVDINEAIPIAMVINELITNSFKHAFNNPKEGMINLTSEMSEKARTIHYRDNGPGISADDGLDNPQSLGMRLVNLMVTQLKGKIVYEGDSNGAYFRIELAAS